MKLNVRDLRNAERNKSMRGVANVREDFICIPIVSMRFIHGVGCDGRLNMSGSGRLQSDFHFNF